MIALSEKRNISMNIIGKGFDIGKSYLVHDRIMMYYEKRVNGKE